MAVWVRSLVPNEKKSARPAIRSAMKQARGSSIIVPTREVAAVGEALLIGDRQHDRARTNSSSPS